MYVYTPNTHNNNTYYYTCNHVPLSLSHLFFLAQYMKAKKSSDVRVERSAVSGKLMKKKVKKSSKDKEVSEY